MKKLFMLGLLAVSYSMAFACAVPTAKPEAPEMTTKTKPAGETEETMMPEEEMETEEVIMGDEDEA